MSVPNFLFIGPDKTGSSWLHSVLMQHPRCHVPACKDLYFFDRYYHKGFAWYLRQFGHIDPKTKAVGELSHDYLFSRLACERIAHDLPDVKLLCCLRDPAERSFSHFLYLRRNGHTRLNFAEALATIPELVGHSRYAYHLQPYLTHFPRPQIKIMFFEDLLHDPADFAKVVFDFLDLDFPEHLDYRRKVREAERTRSPGIARLLSKAAWFTRGLGFPSVVGTVKRSILVRLLYTRFDKTERPHLNAPLRAQIITNLKDDIVLLQSQVDRDLSSWLDPGKVEHA